MSNTAKPRVYLIESQIMKHELEKNKQEKQFKSGGRTVEMETSIPLSE